MVRSGRSTSGMSWLNAIAPASPIAVATGSTLRPQAWSRPRAASASVTSMKPKTPAVASNTVSVGCSRKDSSVVRASVASIDSSDHR